MAEELILPASVTDKFSRPLKDLADKLKNIKPSPGLAAVERNIRNIRQQVEATTKAVKDAGNGLSSGLGLPGLGLGALSAAGAMAALGASVRSFAATTVDMKNFTAATGIAASKLKELKAVAAGLGVSEDAIQNALGFNAQNVDAMRRKQGNFQALQNLGPGGQSIAADLAGSKSNDEALEKSFKYLSQQKTAAQRRTLAGLLFGDESMAALGNESYGQLMKRRSAARASIGQQSKDDEAKAQAFLDATSKVSAALEKIKNSVGGTLAPNLTAVADGMASFANAHAGDIKDFFDGVGKTLREHNWAADAVAINQAFGAVKGFVEYLESLSPKFNEQFKENRDKAADGENYSVWGNTIGARKGSPFDWLLQHQPQWDKLNGKPFINVPPAVASPSPELSPDANQGLRDTMMGDGNLHKSAYRPGQRAAMMGITAARDSLVVATIAAGVTKGMQDFAASLQGGGAAGTEGSGGGFQNASWQPGGGLGRRSTFGGGGSGGSLSYGSVGVKAAVARGNLAKNQKEAYAAARGEGLDHAAALAWVANTSGESLADPSNTSGDGGRAQGIVQWHRDRALAIKQKYGQWPAQMSVTDQTKAGLDEMRRKYPKAWKILTDPNSSTEDKIAALVDDYERPANKPKSYRERLSFLRGLPKDFGNSDTAAPRPSLLKKKAAVDAANAAGAGVQGPHGKVSVEVISKDHPAKVKNDGSPVFQDVTLKRGNLMQI